MHKRLLRISVLTKFTLKASTLSKKPLFMRFPAREQVFFAKRISMLLRSGTSLAESLRLLEADSASTTAAYIYNGLATRIEEGQSLSASLAACGSVFSGLFITMVYVGERSGTLPESLEYLADELKRQSVLRKKVLSALVYPAIIVVATAAIALVLTVYIFPKITPIFKSFHSQLPLPTRILIATSTFFVHEGWWLALGAIGAAIAGAFLIRIPWVHFLIDTTIIRRVPIFGALSRYYNLANSARTLGILAKSDMGIATALQIAAAGTQNLVYRKALQDAARDVVQGQTLSKQLENKPKLFPPLYRQLVRAGETTGHLPESLSYLSSMYEEDIDQLTKNMTTLIEPVLMITMGTIIGFIALSIITPIYGITQQLGTLH